jgi:nitrogen fixation NifU-like protein
MKVYLRLREGLISEARFETYSCPWAKAVGSATTTWLEQRSIEQAGAFNAQVLEAQLKGLPRSKHHCLQLAVRAVCAALSQRQGSEV